MKHTPEAIEAESALLRTQLVAVSSDIRRRADPAAIVEGAKQSFKERAKDAPEFIKQNATPIGIALLGGALGAAATGLLSKSRPSTRKAAEKLSRASSVETRRRPALKSQANAVLLSGAGIGLGYLAGLFVPVSETEQAMLGQPKAVIGDLLNQVLDQHMQGMKGAVANAFGVSRLSGAALVGLALAAEMLGTAARRPERSPL